MAGSIELQWPDDALSDLNRFATLLHEQSSELAASVADAIIARTQILTRHPKLGRPIAGREEYRQIVLQVLGGDCSHPLLTKGIRAMAVPNRILYHGWSDSNVPAVNTIKYGDQVLAHMGGAAKATEHVRLFMAPGMGHCEVAKAPRRSTR